MTRVVTSEIVAGSEIAAKLQDLLDNLSGTYIDSGTQCVAHDRYLVYVIEEST